MATLIAHLQKLKQNVLLSRQRNYFKLLKKYRFIIRIYFINFYTANNIALKYETKLFEIHEEQKDRNNCFGENNFSTQSLTNQASKSKLKN